MALPKDKRDLSARKVSEGTQSMTLPERRELSPGQIPEQKLPSKAEESEWAALIQRIISSDLLKRSPDGHKLLLFLFRNRGEEITPKFVEHKFFREELLKTACPNRTRSAMAISTLRAKVAKYGARETHEDWLCVIPEKSENGTYGLRFSLKPIKPESAAKRFWKPHLDRPEDTVVITGAHLFFYNEETKVVLRLPFFSAKRNWDDEEILVHAKQARKDLDLEGFSPWQNRYLAVGDVDAYETLAMFFHLEAGILIKRETVQSIDIREVRRRSPILLGRPQTNPYLRELTTESARASQLGYKIHDLQGTVKIDGMRDKERKDLRDFPISADGVVGPITERNMAFGIVTRFPSPGGRGVITMISCDYYSMLTGRIVQSLISDSNALEIFDEVGWSCTAIPDVFEMLFTVELFKGSRPDESFPKLITWRVP